MKCLVYPGSHRVSPTQFIRSGSSELSLRFSFYFFVYIRLPGQLELSYSSFVNLIYCKATQFATKCPEIWAKQATQALPFLQIESWLLSGSTAFIFSIAFSTVADSGVIKLRSNAVHLPHPPFFTPFFLILLQYCELL